MQLRQDGSSELIAAFHEHVARRNTQLIIASYFAAPDLVDGPTLTAMTDLLVHLLAPRDELSLQLVRALRSYVEHKLSLGDTARRSFAESRFGPSVLAFFDAELEEDELAEIVNALGWLGSIPALREFRAGLGQRGIRESVGGEIARAAARIFLFARDRDLSDTVEAQITGFVNTTRAMVGQPSEERLRYDDLITIFSFSGSDTGATALDELLRLETSDRLLRRALVAGMMTHALVRTQISLDEKIRHLKDLHLDDLLKIS
jgi:hypothetical protein